MRVISADFAAAILLPQFKPQYLIASVSVLVNPPQEPTFRFADPIFREVESGFEVIVLEAEHDVRGFAHDLERFVRKVKLSEMLNPCAR